MVTCSIKREEKHDSPSIKFTIAYLKKITIVNKVFIHSLQHGEKGTFCHINTGAWPRNKNPSNHQALSKTRLPPWYRLLWKCSQLSQDWTPRRKSQIFWTHWLSSTRKRELTIILYYVNFRSSNNLHQNKKRTKTP